VALRAARAYPQNLWITLCRRARQASSDHDIREKLLPWSKNEQVMKDFEINELRG
jgi:hypothetical protein